MVCAIEDEVVAADYGLCVLGGEVLPVWDVLWEWVKPVAEASADLSINDFKSEHIQPTLCSRLPGCQP